MTNVMMHNGTVTIERKALANIPQASGPTHSAWAGVGTSMKIINNENNDNVG